MCIYVICDRVYIYIYYSCIYIYIYLSILLLLLLLLFLLLLYTIAEVPYLQESFITIIHFWGYEPISPVGIYTMSSYTYRWFGRICDYNIL